MGDVIVDVFPVSLLEVELMELIDLFGDVNDTAEENHSTGIINSEGMTRSSDRMIITFDLGPLLRG